MENQNHQCTACGGPVTPPQRRCNDCSCLQGRQTFAAMQNSNMVLDDRYELIDHLGKGGMGQVWRALDRWLEMEVAIKLLTRKTRRLSLAHDQLEREYKAMARVSHPNVIRVHGFGRALIPDLQAGGMVEVGYFTMQLIKPPQHSLEDLLTIGEVGTPRAFRIARGLADALTALDKAGIIHGDVKPSNIFLVKAERGEQALLSDLSSCRLPEQLPSNIVAGTPSYMSPELIDDAMSSESVKVTCAADVWALGAVLYELFYGEQLFEVPAEIETLPEAAASVRQRMNENYIREALEDLAGMNARLRETLLTCFRLEADKRAKPVNLAASLQALSQSLSF